MSFNKIGFFNGGGLKAQPLQTYYIHSINVDEHNGSVEAFCPNLLAYKTISPIFPESSTTRFAADKSKFSIKASIRQLRFTFCSGKFTDYADFLRVYNNSYRGALISEENIDQIRKAALHVPQQIGLGLNSAAEVLATEQQSAILKR